MSGEVIIQTSQPVPATREDGQNGKRQGTSGNLAGAKLVSHLLAGVSALTRDARVGQVGRR